MKSNVFYKTCKSLYLAYEKELLEALVGRFWSLDVDFNDYIDFIRAQQLVEFCNAEGSVTRSCWDVDSDIPQDVLLKKGKKKKGERVREDL